MPEIPTLLHDFEIDGASRTVAHYRDQATQISRAIEAMTTPWLHLRDQVGSTAGIIGLQEIGHLLNTKAIFDDESARRLRLHLGDWRGRIDWPSDIFTDPVARSDFYVHRGLDPDLTDFPASAFDQAITIAGVKRHPPPLIRTYDPAPEQEPDDEESGFERNNSAHDRLQRFESQVRAFIDPAHEFGIREELDQASGSRRVPSNNGATSKPGRATRVSPRSR